MLSCRLSGYSFSVNQLANQRLLLSPCNNTKHQSHHGDAQTWLSPLVVCAMQLTSWRRAAGLIRRRNDQVCCDNRISSWHISIHLCWFFTFYFLETKGYMARSGIHHRDLERISEESFKLWECVCLPFTVDLKLYYCLLKHVITGRKAALTSIMARSPPCSCTSTLSHSEGREKCGAQKLWRT